MSGCLCTMAAERVGNKTRVPLLSHEPRPGQTAGEPSGTPQRQHEWQHQPAGGQVMWWGTEQR